MKAVNALLLIVLYCIHSAVGTGWGWAREPSQEGESLRGTVSTDLYRCCPGWASGDSINCNIPVCAGRTNPSACNLNEGYVKYKDGRIVRNSGGICVDANTCDNCNEGYYSESGYCRACTPIANCNFPKCQHAGDSRCEYCEGEYTSEYGTYAYTRLIDGGKTCRRSPLMVRTSASYAQQATFVSVS